ncbi:MAG: family 10 glycosylhydrolase [Pseudomonadota bacterium]
MSATTQSVTVAVAVAVAVFFAGCKSECSCEVTCDAEFCYEPGEDTMIAEDLSTLEDVPDASDGEPTDVPRDPDLPSSDTPDPEDTLADVDDTEAPLGGELRGLWVTRWDYGSASDVEGILQDAADWGFNAVFFQVRAIGDAYYDSAVEPWAKGLSGTLGQDPGWDPLAVAIVGAHGRGLELHAWVNTFTAWSGTSPPTPSDPPHILYSHPEWRQAGADGAPMAWNSSYTWVSPGIPGVRDHILAVVDDIVSHYDVDGIHLDYVRYAGPGYSHDPWSEAAYAAAVAVDPGLSWGDHQRDVLSDFVGTVTATATASDPAVKVTAAVWGIHQDVFGWGGTSKGYDDYYQNSHRWTEEGLIDAICPMIYWPLTNPPGLRTDFGALVNDHLSAAGDRHVYPGLKADYEDFGEVAAEIEFVRSVGAPGFLVFAYSTVVARGHGPALAAGPFAEPADPPAMPWK